MRDAEPILPDPRAWCRWLIRPYVERGTSLDVLIRLQEGACGPPRGHRPYRYDVRIGNDILYDAEWDPFSWRDHPRWSRRLCVARDEIGAVLEGPDLCEVGVFRVADLMQETRAGARQVSLFEVAS